PAPLPADAVATEFSATRAMEDIRAIASTPHATGTSALAAARAHLAARLTALGFAWREETFPIVPRTAALLKRWGGDSAATGVNLVAWRRGADSTGPALALMAHYDGVWGSPAAADDAFGVAAALEIARAIPPESQRRDLIVIFTDAEEIGLVGARSFFARDSGGDPLAARVGVLINLEARGGGGLASMFQTNVDNGAIMALYRDAVRQPLANSIAVSIYERLPNGTDFTPALERGVRGFNIANIGDARLYHSPLATPDEIDPGSLQHLGAQALDLSRALLTADALPGNAPAAVFSDVFGLTMFVYSPATGWWLIAVVVVLLGFAAYHRRTELRARSSAGAVFDGLVVLIVAALLLFAGNLVSLNALSGGAKYYDRLAALPRLELQAVLLVLATVIGSTAMWRRGPSDRVIGLSVLTLIVAVATQWYLPGGGPIFTWPLLLAALSFFVQSLLPIDSTSERTVAVLAATLGLAWLGGFAHFLLLAVGADVPSALTALLLPALALLAPIMPEWPRRTALSIAGVLVLAAMAVALWVRLDAIAPSIAVYALP
ncbi:MAG: M20/M25/M40 family metallo-hydrolase, partial [Gemmatimonadaceae bacterium]